jgi:hypothetical protein
VNSIEIERLTFEDFKQIPFEGNQGFPNILILTIFLVFGEKLLHHYILTYLNDSTGSNLILTKIKDFGLMILKNNS